MTESLLTPARGYTTWSSDKGPIGIAYAQLNWSTSTVWPLAKLVMYYPCWLDGPMTVVRMGWQNGGTVDASGHVMVGVYNDAFGFVGGMTSTTTVQSGTTALQVVTVTGFTLSAFKDYYVAITCDSTTSTFGLPATAPAAGLSGACGIMSETTVAFGLPATATPTVPTNETLTQVIMSSSTLL